MRVSIFRNRDRDLPGAGVISNAFGIFLFLVNTVGVGRARLARFFENQFARLEGKIALAIGRSLVKWFPLAAGPFFKHIGEFGVNQHIVRVIAIFNTFCTVDFERRRCLGIMVRKGQSGRPAAFLQCSVRVESRRFGARNGQVVFLAVIHRDLDHNVLQFARISNALRAAGNLLDLVIVSFGSFFADVFQCLECEVAVITGGSHTGLAAGHRGPFFVDLRQLELKAALIRNLRSATLRSKLFAAADYGGSLIILVLKSEACDGGVKGDFFGCLAIAGQRVVGLPDLHFQRTVRIRSDRDLEPVFLRRIRNARLSVVVFPQPVIIRLAFIVFVEGSKGVGKGKFAACVRRFGRCAAVFDPFALIIFGVLLQLEGEAVDSVFAVHRLLPFQGDAGADTFVDIGERHSACTAAHSLIGRPGDRHVIIYNDRSNIPAVILFIVGVGVVFRNQEIVGSRFMHGDGGECDAAVTVHADIVILADVARIPCRERGSLRIAADNGKLEVAVVVLDCRTGQTLAACERKLCFPVSIGDGIISICRRLVPLIGVDGLTIQFHSRRQLAILFADRDRDRLFFRHRRHARHGAGRLREGIGKRFAYIITREGGQRTPTDLHRRINR